MEERTYHVIERAGAWDVIELGRPAPQFSNARPWAMWRATFADHGTALRWVRGLADEFNNQPHPSCRALVAA